MSLIKPHARLLSSPSAPAFVPAPPVPQPPSSAAAPMPPAHPPPPHEDEPVSKKLKTEDNLIPEEEYLRRNKVCTQTLTPLHNIENIIIYLTAIIRCTHDIYT